MGEHKDYWCARCGLPAPVTVKVMFSGVGKVQPSLKERICGSVDCAADILQRHADRLRAHALETQS